LHSRITVVLAVISTLLFSCPFPTFFQVALGGIAVNNFVKQLNVDDMKKNIIRWIWSVMEMFQKS